MQEQRGSGETQGERRDEQPSLATEPADHRGPETSDAQVVAIAQQLAEVIDRSTLEDRAALGEFARDLIVEETEDAIRRADQAEEPSCRRKPLGAFAAALLLLPIGGFFLVAFPPVGIMLLLIGVVTVVWGIVQQVIARLQSPAERVEEAGDGERPPEPDRAGGDLPNDS
jgi:hypothetical protein